MGKKKKSAIEETNVKANVNCLKFFPSFFEVKLTIVCMHVAEPYPTLQPHGLQPTKFPCSWNFPGKKTGMCACRVASVMSDSL